MVKQNFWVLILFCFLSLHCKKTAVDAELPPETQTGAGTFACLINGAVWQYKNADNFFTTPKTRWEFDPSMYGGYLYIGGIRYVDGVNSTDLLSLVSDSLLFKKEKIINKPNLEFGVRFIRNDSNVNECKDYSTAAINDTTRNFYSSGKLTISKLDQTAKIIAGTFYCTIKQNGCDSLKITDGRFDIKYQ